MSKDFGSRTRALGSIIAMTAFLGVVGAGCNVGTGSVTVSTLTVTADPAEDADSGPTAAGAVFDATKVAADVAQLLAGEPPAGYGLTGVTTVVCPSGQPIAKGTTFVCSAMIEGAVTSVPVTVTGDENDPAERGSYQVGIPQ